MNSQAKDSGVSSPAPSQAAKPMSKDFTARGTAKYCYVPREHEDENGNGRFKTSDRTRYVRDGVTGMIRRVR